MKTTEELYQEFRSLGYDHQQARQLSLEATKLLLEEIAPELIKILKD